MVRALPIYRTIFEELYRDIASGHYKSGQKFPSEATLGKRFGASRITVRHALRELQQHGLIDRVAGSGTYVRGVTDHASKPLLFGLIIPNLGETEIFEPICQGIASSPDMNGHALLWSHADRAAESKGEQALQLCRQCITRAVAGVFFAPLELSPRSADVNRRVMSMLQSAQIPVVLLDRRPADSSSRERSDLAGIDNHRAGYLATAHLLRLGMRRIGFLAYDGQASTVKARISGYKEALSTWTADEGHAQVFFTPANSPVKLPPAALECDSFVCANDRVAGQLMRELLARQVRIPQDIRIVGIDDVNYAALLPVPLTTVRQPCADIGQAALRLMLERLDRPQMAARDVLLDCELVVRESCGATSLD